MTSLGGEYVQGVAKILIVLALVITIFPNALDMVSQFGPKLSRLGAELHSLSTFANDPCHRNPEDDG